MSSRPSRWAVNGGCGRLNSGNGLKIENPAASSEKEKAVSAMTANLSSKPFDFFYSKMNQSKEDELSHNRNRPAKMFLLVGLRQRLIVLFDSRHPDPCADSL
jgi:hypothetical protein